MPLAAARPWLSSVLLAVLVFLTSSASAGMSPEEVKAFEGYKAKAGKGDPVAQFNLGNCHYKGEGVAKDMVEAVKWYRKAADKGLADAQFNLGACYCQAVDSVRVHVFVVRHRVAHVIGRTTMFRLLYKRRAGRRHAGRCEGRRERGWIQSVESGAEKRA